MEKKCHISLTLTRFLEKCGKKTAVNERFGPTARADLQSVHDTTLRLQYLFRVIGIGASDAGCKKCADFIKICSFNFVPIGTLYW